MYHSNGCMDRGSKVSVYYKRNNPADAYVVTCQESLFNTVIGLIHGICRVLLSIVAFAVILLNRKKFVLP